MPEKVTPKFDEDWEEWKPSEMSFIAHMVAGSFAGVAEHVFMFPLDTVKTFMQCDRCGSSDPLKTWKCAKTIVGSQGPWRLWRGVSATFAGCIPAHAAYFSIYESMKILTGADQGGHHPVEAALCGAGAALSHDLFMTPFDTIKQRMQLGYYRSMLHCTSSVVRNEGLRAMYVALPATLIMNLPYGMIMVATNESCRKWLNPTDGHVSISTSLIAGSIAGGVAAALTTPLDTLKTRLQTNDLTPIMGEGGMRLGHAPSSANYVGGVTVTQTRNIASAPRVRKPTPSTNAVAWLYQSTAQAARKIWREAGIQGYFRGVVPRVLTHSPSVAISWTTYEAAKSFILR